MKKSHMILLIAAVLAILTGSVGGALAYFTASASARGQRSLSIVKPTTHVEETVVSGTKHVSVVNDKDSQPVFVRVRAFCGEEYQLETSSQDSAWVQQGDFWTYRQVLQPGTSTPELLIHIKELPAAVNGDEHFNIVVVEETSPVAYTPQGVPYAVWEQEGGRS